MQSPNVLGYVHCSETGDVLVQEGNEVDVLASVLVYFHQVAMLIGDSFGLEGFHEAHIQGKSLMVICLPHQGGTVGLLVNTRARVAEIVTQARRILAIS